MKEFSNNLLCVLCFSRPLGVILLFVRRSQEPHFFFFYYTVKINTILDEAITYKAKYINSTLTSIINNMDTVYK